MEKKNRLIKIICWILFAIQTAGTAILLKILPESIPMHFNSKGKVDRYGSKNELIIMVVLSLLALLIFEGMSKDKSEKQLSSDDERQIASGRITKYVYRISEAVFILIMIAVELSLALSGLKSPAELQETDSIDWLMMAMNLIFALILVVFGNILPKTRNNSLFGVRTSWSQYNDETWYRTNRNAGRLGVIAGLVSLFIALFVPYRTARFIILGIIVVWAVICIIISYNVYRDVIGRDNEKGSR